MVSGRSPSTLRRGRSDSFRKRLRRRRRGLRRADGAISNSSRRGPADVTIQIVILICHLFIVSTIIRFFILLVHKPPLLLSTIEGFLTPHSIGAFNCIIPFILEKVVGRRRRAPPISTMLSRATVEKGGGQGTDRSQGDGSGECWRNGGAEGIIL